MFVGFARDLVALLWVGVVSGNGAVSSQHASDVVVEPWARILRAYAPREDDEQLFRRGPERDGAIDVTAEALQQLITRMARVVHRQTL